MDKKEELRVAIITILKNYEMIKKLSESGDVVLKCKDTLIFIDDKQFEEEISKLIEAERLIYDATVSIVDKFEEVLE